MRKSKKFKNLKWCDRPLLWGNFLALATTEEGYREALDHLSIPANQISPHGWLNPGSSATTHFYLGKEHGNIAIVCIPKKNASKHSKHVINALLTHEATHVFQDKMEDIGEKYPGNEIEAYCIQAITQTLMEEYWGKN